ncbi:MAG: paraquat-inducible protein A [Xanthomonadales bacterium]|jgi:paraquat-inducible protein A|nr:paraquat-inducible protein A [Xanthomonadales bacterium]
MPPSTSAYYGQNLVSCHQCDTVQAAGQDRCSFCGHALHGRKRYSLQRAWSFLTTALILYVPANVLPIMTTSELGDETLNTIAGGVVTLWGHGDYLIALIILIASLLVPLAKFVALITLCLGSQFTNIDKPHTKVAVYRLTEFVGRWSMVDVFVVAFLASLIQLGNLMSVHPGPAALAFAGMVVFSMLAANSLDPKLFWDDYEHHQQH